MPCKLNDMVICFILILRQKMKKVLNVPIQDFLKDV